MRGTDYAALVDRLARAVAWTELTDQGKRRCVEVATNVLSELEADHEAQDKIGWMFVSLDEADTEGVTND